MSGNQIQVPGQPRRGEANPLMMLATTIDKTNNHLHDMTVMLAAIADNTKKESRHVYAMARRDESTWGTYCLACSESAEQYVYPCEVVQNDDRPPSHITILPPITDPLD